MSSEDAAELEAGDIVWIEFGPPMGHEQAGRRPALVVSRRPYNEISSLIIVCPITRNIEPWAFKIMIKNPGRIQGAVLVDHIRAIDRHARHARRAERADMETLAAVYGMIIALLGMQFPA